MKIKLFFAGLAIIATTSFVSAQPGSGNGSGRCNRTGNGTAYVDKNNNGVCDNYENRQASQRNRNGAGKGDGTGQGRHNEQGRGRNFVDADKNGVCDNYEARNKK